MAKKTSVLLPKNTYIRTTRDFTPHPIQQTAIKFHKGTVFHIKERSSNGRWWLAKNEKHHGGHWGWIPVDMVERYQAPMRWSRL
jgi:hypothetical protein